MEGSWGILAAAALAAGALAGYRHIRLQARVRRRRERAREQDRLDQLAAGLAHQLKNPLGSLSLNLQLIEEELEEAGTLSEASRARFAAVKRDYHRFEDVLNAFLRYAGRRQLAAAEVDLVAVVDEVLTFIKPEIVRGAIRLEAALPETPLVCRIDAPLVKQALLNVMLNAIEAMSASGTLGVSARGDAGEVSVSVSDTGGGISADDMPRIFDAYFSRKKDGTGLGLAIARRIIEDHDGRIEVESPPATGARVTIHLPAQGRGDAVGS